MNNYYVTQGFGLKAIPEEAELSVDFAEIEIQKTPQDQRDDWDWKLEKNLTSLIEIMKEQNPDLTNEEAQQILADNRTSNSILGGKAGKFELLTQTKEGIQK